MPGTGDWRDDLGDGDGVHDAGDVVGRSPIVLAGLAGVFAEADAVDGDANGDDAYAWGWRVETSYDALGRQESVRHRQDPGWSTGQQGDGVYQAGGGETDRTTTWTYANDSDGRMIREATPEGILNYGHDVKTGRHAATWTGSDAWDWQVAPDTPPTSADSATRYTHDRQGRLTGVKALRAAGDQVVHETLYQHGAAGQLLLETSNGATTARFFDPLGRLWRQETTNGTGGVLATFDYKLGKAGHRLQVDEQVDADPTAAGFEYQKQATYAYDALYRLTGETVTETLADGTLQGYEQQYAFDLVGNRLAKAITPITGRQLPSGFAAGTTQSDYNARDQLLEQRDAAGTLQKTFAYDANGSLTTQFDATGTATVTQGYDLRNRMTEYEKADGSDFAHVRLGYDGREGRVLRQVLDANGSVTAIERFLLDRSNPTGYEQVLVQMDANGTPTRGFVLGRDVTAQVTPTATTAAKVLTLLYDAHGSTRGLVDATGQLADGHVYSYDAFGVRSDGLPQVLTPLQYAGEWVDPLTGLGYNRHRHLSFETGRFIARDGREAPTGDIINANLYVYAFANGLNAIDPSGYALFSDVLSTMGIKTLLRGINTVKKARFVQVAKKTIDLLQFTSDVRDIILAIQGTPQISSYFTQLATAAMPAGITGKKLQDWKKLQGMTLSHLQMVTQAVASEAPLIFTHVFRKHSKLLAKVAAGKADGGSYPRLVIGLPSLPGDYLGSTKIGIGKDRFTVGGTPITFAKPINGVGGSLFSIGFVLRRGGDIHQVFRLDYHGQRNYKDGDRANAAAVSPTQYKFHGEAFQLGGWGAEYGDHINGVGKPKFHWHVPDSFL